MARHARIGDRDTRSDDRYLFLETLMAARSRLHLSYHCEGAQDARPRNPAAPLAELMAFLDARLGAERAWYVKHPLQPFDARYFDGGDPRLSSFSREFAAMVATSAESDDRFVAAMQPATALPEFDASAAGATAALLPRPGRASAARSPAAAARRPGR